MAEYPGALGAVPSLVTFQLPGKSAGTAYPQVTNLGMVVPSFWPGIDSWTSGGGGPPGGGGGGHAGAKMLGWTFDIDWFEKIHLLPRATVAFGQIVSSIDERFELFSAFRKANTTMTDVTINVAGISLPYGPVDANVLGPLTSFLGPDTADLVPTGQIIRALPAGPASFSSTVVFTFSGGFVLTLRITGTRINLISMDFDGGDVREILEWATDILPKKSGKEQRIAKRKQPRQIWDVGFHLTDQDRQRWHALMFDGQHIPMALPIWPEQMKLTAAVTGGVSATVSVDSTANIDLRIGASAIVYKDARTNEILNVLSFTSTTVTFDAIVQSSYAIGDFVVPVRTVCAEPRLQGERYPVTLERFRVRLRVHDNDTGAPTGSLSGWSSYNGKLMADDSNFVRGTMPTALERKMTVLDNETGLTSQETPWDRSKQDFEKTWIVKSRADLYKLRRLIYALRGQQVSFYYPTFIEELTPTQNLVSADDKLFIENIGYTTRIAQRLPKSVFRITFTDGTSLVRTITASVVIDADEERLTLNTTWPANRTVAEVSRIQFYTLVRATTDEWAIDYGDTVGRARVTVPMKIVFDDIT